jgi:hypothetical protein
VKDQLVLLSPEQQLYWATIYNDLLCAEDELSRAMAIIDGSRPDEKKPLDIEPLAECDRATVRAVLAALVKKA